WSAVGTSDRGGTRRVSGASPAWPWAGGFCGRRRRATPVSRFRQHVPAPNLGAGSLVRASNSPRLRQPFVPRRPVTHALALRPAHIGAFLGVAEEPAAAHVIDLGAGIGPHDRVAGAVALHVACAGRAGRSRSRLRRLSQPGGGAPILVPQPRLRRLPQAGGGTRIFVADALISRSRSVAACAPIAAARQAFPGEFAIAAICLLVGTSHAAPLLRAVAHAVLRCGLRHAWYGSAS